MIFNIWIHDRWTKKFRFLPVTWIWNEGPEAKAEALTLEDWRSLVTLTCIYKSKHFSKQRKSISNMCYWIAMKYLRRWKRKPSTDMNWSVGRVIPFPEDVNGAGPKWIHDFWHNPSHCPFGLQLLKSLCHSNFWKRRNISLITIDVYLLKHIFIINNLRLGILFHVCYGNLNRFK